MKKIDTDYKRPNLVPRVSHLTATLERTFAPGGGKMRDPGNEVASDQLEKLRLNFSRRTNRNEAPSIVNSLLKRCFGDIHFVRGKNRVVLILLNIWLRNNMFVDTACKRCHQRDDNKP